MTLLFDGKNAFFSERERSFARGLVIHIPRSAALFFNGVCYFPAGDTVHLPDSAIRRGENRLALRVENRVYPTEGLFYDGECFSPMGIAAEPILLRQNERIASLEESLSLLEKRIAGMEKKAAARMLFS